MVNNRLVVAIVTFNSEHHIASCVNELGKNESDVSVIVRDNASSDATPNILSKLHAEGKINELILAGKNDGFAVAVNDVIQRAEGCDILLLNPDARISADAIAVLRRAITDDHALGLVAPVVYGGSEISVMSAGRLPTLWPMITHYTGLSRAFPNRPCLKGRHLFLDAHSQADQYVEWTSGCCVLIPRRTIDLVGVLNERWFMYGEDTEYCKRAIDAGLAVKVLADARAYHEVGMSTQAVGGITHGSETGTDSLPKPTPRASRTHTMWAKNLYDFYVTEYRPSTTTRIAWKTTFTLGNALRAAIRLAKRPSDDKARRLMKNAFAVWT